MNTQDPELSAALGWPGGISDPVLDRKALLQMVAALRLVAQQALEALEDARTFTGAWPTGSKAITNLRAALVHQKEPDLFQCPQCNGPADNGFDRSIPPNPYLCTKCIAEPVEPVAALIAQRDALLEALKEVLTWGTDQNYVRAEAACDKARAAIALVEGRVKTVEGTK